MFPSPLWGMKDSWRSLKHQLQGPFNHHPTHPAGSTSSHESLWRLEQMATCCKVIPQDPRATSSAGSRILPRESTTRSSAWGRADPRSRLNPAQKIPCVEKLTQESRASRNDFISQNTSITREKSCQLKNRELSSCEEHLWNWRGNLIPCPQLTTTSPHPAFLGCIHIFNMFQLQQGSERRKIHEFFAECGWKRDFLGSNNS